MDLRRSVRLSLKATREKKLKGFISRCTSHCMQMKTDICNEVSCSLCRRTFKLNKEVGRKVRDHLCTDHPSKSTHVQYDGSSFSTPSATPKKWRKTPVSWFFLSDQTKCYAHSIFRTSEWRRRITLEHTEGLNVQ